MVAVATKGEQDRSPDGTGPPPALAPPPGHPRFPHVDGARAVAALTIVGLHVAGSAGFRQEHSLGWLTSRLGVGVTIFFVISGFLLYRPFVAGRLGQAPTPRVASFWQRRALRIVPAYWAALVAVILSVAVGATTDHHDLLTERAPVYFGFLQIYAERTLEGGLPHAWTLCVEVTFYLLLPGIAAVAAWLAARGAPPWTEMLLIAGLGLASIVARGVLVEPGRLQWEQATLPTLFAWFAPGMMLAVASATGSVPRWVAWLARRPLVSWGLAVAIYLIFSSPDAPDMRGVLVVDYVVNLVIAVLFFIPAVMTEERDALPRRLLRWGPVAWLGLVSYGIYLWHIPVLWLLIATDAIELVPGAPAITMLVLTLVLTLIAAAASYYVVERPFLRLKHRGRRRI